MERYHLRTLGLIPFILLSISHLNGAAASSPVTGGPGCEPGVEVALSARVVSVTEREDRAHAVIELTLDPLVNILDSRILGTVRQRRGRRPEIPERALPLAAGLRRHLLYEVELAPGKNHDILFSVERQGTGEPVPGATTWVRIPLDPTTLPEKTTGLIQYRARSGGQ